MLLCFPINAGYQNVKINMIVNKPSLVVFGHIKTFQKEIMHLNLSLSTVMEIKILQIGCIGDPVRFFKQSIHFLTQPEVSALVTMQKH